MIVMLDLVLVHFPSTRFCIAYGSAVVPSAFGSIVAHSEMFAMVLRDAIEIG